MKIPLDLINGGRVASPCPVSWAQMAGDDRVRHCSQCDQAVYDLSAMTAAEVASLLGANDEDVCVRLYRRADGTVMTKDCPRGIAVGAVAILSWVAVAVTALIGFFLLRGPGNYTFGPRRGDRTMGKISLPKDRLQGAGPAVPE